MGSRNKSQVCLLAPWSGGQGACSVYGARVGQCSAVRSQGCLRWSANPSGVLSAGGMHNTLLLLLTPSFCSGLFRSGSWVFGLLCGFGQNLSYLYTCAITFLVRYSFLYSVAEEWWVQVLAMQHRSKGPRSQPVSLNLDGKHSASKTFGGDFISKFHMLLGILM